MLLIASDDQPCVVHDKEASDCRDVPWLGVVVTIGSDS
jgi:hypothetical protein